MMRLPFSCVLTEGSRHFHIAENQSLVFICKTISVCLIIWKLYKIWSPGGTFKGCVPLLRCVGISGLRYASGPCPAISVLDDKARRMGLRFSHPAS